MKLSRLLLLTFTLLTATAQAKLPAEIAKLSGKEGVFTSLFNGKSIENETGTRCTIEESQYGEGSVIIDSISYFTPTAHLDGATKTVQNGVVTYVTTNNGKRPGGSVCGDYTPLTSYTQTVIVTAKSLTLKQKYTCALFDRNEIVETCTLK